MRFNMQKLEFTVTGVLTKYSATASKGQLIKRCAIKSTEEDDIVDFVESLASWGKSTDAISNLSIPHNTEDNPYGKATIPLDEYGIYMTMSIDNVSVDVHMKSVTITVKSKKIKGEGVKKVMEAVWNFEHPKGEEDSKIECFLNYKEDDPMTGKSFFKPFEYSFVQCESYEQEEPEEDEEA